MADATTTGSTVIGIVSGGLQKGLLGATSVGSASIEFSNKVLIVFGDPDEVVTSSVGSQLAFNVEDHSIHMSDLKGGSEWTRLRTV